MKEHIPVPPELEGGAEAVAPPTEEAKLIALEQAVVEMRHQYAAVQATIGETEDYGEKWYLVGMRTQLAFYIWSTQEKIMQIIERGNVTNARVQFLTEEE